MTHTCPDCGMCCTCDMEDHESDAPDDCCHECEQESEDLDIGVVGCFHQYVRCDGYAECNVCGDRYDLAPLEKLAAEYAGELATVYKLTTQPFIIIDEASEVKWSELQDPTTWKPIK